MTLWLKSWEHALERLKKADQPPRVAIMGIGHELNGDDAAGIVASRALQPRLADRSWLLVIDAGPAPENQTGPLRAFRPDLVLLIDAAQMNEPPGTVCWVDWQDTTGISASSHTLPLYMLAKFLTFELGCELGLLGIQPSQNEIDSPLSPVVQQAVDEVVHGLSETLLGL